MKPSKTERRRNVTAQHYDPETGALTITFHSGKKYRYDGVPKDLADRIQDHPSPGGFLHSHIIGKFDHTILGD